MADITNPILPAQDLEINLDKAPKIEIQTPAIATQATMDLDLNLDLPDAPKNDDRLKNEDILNSQKNNEPVVEAKTEAILPPVMEVASPLIQETKVETIIAPSREASIEPLATISTTVETETITTAIATEALKQDIHMIAELESNTNAWGLAPEAFIPPQAIITETTKTFDLDAMLGITPTPTLAQEPTLTQVPVPTPIIPPELIPPPTIQTTPVIQQTPTVQTLLTPQLPIENKHIGVKVMLFGVLFIALGFTTFFILQTMYPIEFGNIFSGTQTNIQTAADSTWTIETATIETAIIETQSIDTWASTEVMWSTDTSLTGTIDPGTTTDVWTGNHESAVNTGIFGELNDLGTIDATPPQTDIGRLTEYASQGNDFLTQGKELGNTTVIKYGLYISKKSTTFLEKIASGEQITNLSWYFAQFDQYITALKKLVGQTDTVASSPSPPTNDISGMTPDTQTPNINPFGVSE